jgi:hypothetical protein
VIVFFAYPNGKEEQFIPNNIKELYVYNLPEGFRQYLTLDEEYYLSNYGILYRVVVDGPCRLVADRVKNSLPLNSSSAFTEAHYYMLYKKKFTPVKVEFGEQNSDEMKLKVSGKFLAKNIKTFAECKKLTTEIESNTLATNDLIEIVKRFNECIKK